MTISSEDGLRKRFFGEEIRKRQQQMQALILNTFYHRLGERKLKNHPEYANRMVRGPRRIVLFLFEILLKTILDVI